jgi:peptide/nickel transport system substrate-binding protein
MTQPAPSTRPLSRLSRRLVAVLSALAMLMMVGCTTAGTPSEPPGHTLTIGATSEPDSMDAWHNAAAAIPQVVLYNVYETLVKVDADGKLKALLAQAWELSPDGLTYTFHLNPAAKFASGAPVDAAAVVANIDRLKSDSNLVASLQAQASVMASATAVDTHVVQIKLVHPSIMWLYNMSSTLGMMLDPSFTGDVATTTAGSGPYALKSQSKGQSVVLAPNTNYWGTPARFNEVTFRYYTDANAMNASMLSGDLDVISNLQAPDALSQFSDTSRFTTISGTTNGEVVLGLNHKTKALAKLEVRRALTMAIDRQQLLNTVWNGQGTLIGSMSVPTDPWYEDLTGTNPYNPDQARALLKEAGYAQGLTLRLRVPTFPYAQKSAQFVASALRDVGVTVKVEELDFTRWLKEVYGDGDYDMTIVAHVEARDLGNFALPNYYWHYGDPKFAALYNAADQAKTEAESITLMKEALRYLADDAAAIWLFALPNLVIAKSTITGLPKNATTLSFDLSTIAGG